MNRTERGASCEEKVDCFRPRYTKTFCGCVDLRTGSYIIATSTLILGIIEVCMGMIGVRIASEETMRVGIIVCCSILIAFALILIFFSFILYVGVQHSDVLLLDLWIHFTSIFTCVCFVFLALCVALLAWGLYSTEHALAWSIMASVVFATYGAFLAYGRIVVQSYERLLKDRKEALDELRENIHNPNSQNI